MRDLCNEGEVEDACRATVGRLWGDSTATSC